MNILLVDDDSGLRKSIRIALETMSHKVTEARDGSEALEFLGHGLFDVAFLDVRLGQEGGLDLLPELLRLSPGQAIVVITAYATIEIAVEAMRRGATDFLPKPFTPSEIRIVLDRVARLRRLQSHVEDLEERVKSIFPEVELDTEEPAMQQVLDLAYRKCANREASILLRGESGTGKGVVARAIHARSQRASGPFITAVLLPVCRSSCWKANCLGRAVRGASVAAVQDTLGKVAVAEGGTLFLDEIGDLPPALQPKLLRLSPGRQQYESRVGEILDAGLQRADHRGDE